MAVPEEFKLVGLAKIIEAAIDEIGDASEERDSDKLAKNVRELSSALRLMTKKVNYATRITASIEILAGMIAFIDSAEVDDDS